MSPFSHRIHCYRFIPILLSILLLNGTVHRVNAEEISTHKWHISADKKITRHKEPNRIVAEGNVILEKKEKIPPKPTKDKSIFTTWAELLEEDLVQTEIIANKAEQPAPTQYKTTATIRADWMDYDMESNLVRAKGNVQIITEEDKLFAKESTINLATETGFFTNATIIRKSKSLHLEGKKIEKTGFDTYRIFDGWAITCKLEENASPPWSFSSSRVDIRQNGYAVFRNAKFNIKNIPVFYTPLLVVPVKNTRQTGFLFPELSSSTNDGLGINIPFFLNISDSTDATFFPEFLQNRGFMPTVEHRYVSSSTNKGVFTASYLDDKLSKTTGTDYFKNIGYTHSNSDRYWIRGKADHSFADWQSRLDIDIVSDQDYLNEFNSSTTGFQKSHNRYLKTFGRGFQNQTNTLRHNSFKVLQSGNGISLQANLLAINDADTRSSDTNTPLWKLPSIDFAGDIPLGDSTFFLGWDASYVNYWRKDGVGSHRFDIHPSISTPVPLSPYLESMAKIALRNTSYIVEEYGEAKWDKSTTQNRFIADFTTEIATTLERDFSQKNVAKSGYTHLIRPFIKYNYIPKVDQETLPQFDNLDFIAAKNTITYGIDNFLTTFNAGISDREYGYLKLAQSYALQHYSADEPFSEISVKLGWKPLKNLNIGYKMLYDGYDDIFTSHGLETTYRNNRGDSFRIDYSFKEDSNIEQINGSFLVNIIDQWIAKGGIEHSISQDETIKANSALIYQAPCWSVKFEVQYTPAETTYFVLFNLTNIGIPFGVDF